MEYDGLDRLVETKVAGFADSVYTVDDALGAIVSRKIHFYNGSENLGDVIMTRHFHPGGVLPGQGHWFDEYYYHKDDQGSVVAITDHLGQLVEWYEYSDYGVPTIYAPNGTVRTASAIGNWFLYTGHRWFPELRLYYCRNRWYDPYIQRFLTRDPLGLWGDPMNLGNGTAYVGMNPWTFVDPLGLLTPCQKVADWSDETLWNPIKGAIAHPRMPAYVGAPLFAGLSVFEGLTDGLRLGTTAGETAANPDRTWGDIGLATVQEAGRAMTVAGVSGAALGKIAQVTRGAKAVDDVADAAAAASKTDEAATLAAQGPIRWGPATGEGPLGAKIAETFRSASYSEVVTSEATTLYRVWGGTAREIGPYWTRTAPHGPLQAKIDSALLPQWGNTGSNISAIQVPSGTRIYEGFAAPQCGLMGGGSQVVIQKVDPSWLIK